MTNKEILLKAVEKATKNGMSDEIPHSIFSFEFSTWNWHNTIFSHDFAKAFWGEEDVCGVDGEEYPLCKIHTGRIGIVWVPSWQFHLQQMVLEEDPVKYLERFL